jgi:hypothetical protein
MSNITLDNVSRQEIRTIVSGLKGKRLTEELTRLSEQLGVSKNALYNHTKDLRPTRKTRADKGERKYDISHPSVQFALEQIIDRNVDPDWAIRIANDNDFPLDISVGTMNKYLREHQLGLKQRKNPIRPYRRWEADRPGKLFQFDISAAKERWLDRTTRRILKVSNLEVSKNHPNDDPNRVPLWRFVLVDDFSRMCFVRYYAIAKENSIDIADFILRAFRELGVPEILYTDNAATIVSKLMQRGERILNDAFLESGGYRMLQHLPGNAQASGKVERFHQKFEKMERLIGVKKFTPDLEGINNFCVEACKYLNNDLVHSTTRQKPIARWQSINHTLRIPTEAALDAAFKCREFERVIGADLTINFEGEIYQLPRTNDTIIRDWVGKKIKVLWPSADADWFSICNPNDLFYEDVWLTVDRRLAAPDNAGEFKSVSDNVQQSVIKTTKARAKERRKLIDTPENDIKVPGFDTPLSLSTSHTISFPKKRLELTAEQLAAVAPGTIQVTKELNFWEAFILLKNEELLSADEADKNWLKTVFGATETLPENDIRIALEKRNQPVQNVINYDWRKTA